MSEIILLQQAYIPKYIQKVLTRSWAFLWTIFLAFAFLYPWQIAFKGTSINAPIADILALIILVLFTIRYITGTAIIRKKTKQILLPFIALYTVFLMTALISVFNVYDHDIAQSFHYFLRFPVFAFMAYVIYPSIYLKHAKQFEYIFSVLFWVGIGIAFYGFASLFLAEHAGYIRVEPFGLFGIFPLGHNHNLIGEALVSIFPLALYQSYKYYYKRMYIYGTIFIGVITLLTLSRAAWIAFTIQIGVLLLNKSIREKIIFYTKKWKYLLFIVFGMIVLYMTLFLGTNIVSGSTESRVFTTEVSLFYFKEAPLLGNGPGSYLHISNNTKAIVLEYGEALDAHGILQKLILETGILGVISFCIFLGYIFMSFWKQRQVSHLHSVLIASAVGAIIFQFFNTSYFGSVMWLSIGLVIASFGIIEPYEQ
jgi:hypothetical protein